MQEHPQGRQVQVARHWAARQIAGDFREVAKAERIERARQFLVQEELDSGIVVGRGDELRFWHLTFQEYLAARAIAARAGEVGKEQLFTDERLHCARVARDGAAAGRRAVPPGDRPGGRDDRRACWTALGKRPTLGQQARAVGLLGAAVADLAPVRYQPGDPRYRQTLDAVLGIFQPKQPRADQGGDRRRGSVGPGRRPAAGQDATAGRTGSRSRPASSGWGRRSRTRTQPNHDPEAYERRVARASRPACPPIGSAAIR